jgi:hypothetical protein
MGDSVSDQVLLKVSKLTESAAGPRPAPIISFVPRQRDLRDLVSKSAVGNEVTSLFDMLKYWDGRFEQINLDDANLPAIVHERLLKPKDQAAKAQLDTHGERGTREAFRLTYPFSPAFTHAMVDISGALQRERTALKLMQQLLVNYRDTATLLRGTGRGRRTGQVAVVRSRRPVVRDRPVDAGRAARRGGARIADAAMPSGACVPAACLSIRLRSDLRPTSWRGVIDAVQDRLCLPEVDEKALTGLKFSEALPRPLAVATLAARLADLDHARTVLVEPTRFER